MASQPLTMAFVMDPIQDVVIDADTTFVLMLEAQERGHQILYLDQANIAVGRDGACALATPVVLRRELGNHVDLAAPRRVVFDQDVDVAFQRKDPPVDTEYITATQILALCERTLVLNRPESVLAANEKLYALRFADLMTDTLVTRSDVELRDFVASMGGEMIVKPLHGKGGEGIFHIVKGDRNLSSIIEQATQFGTSWTMAQRYIPAVREGDKRILLLEGEPIGAVLRVPADNETRANLHVGGRAVKAPLDDADRKIIERVAPYLREDGFFFVGIDVIGGCLTEVNVTSPTGIQEINALDDACLEAQVIDRVEQRVAERRS
jgi:glutathione synthase